MTAIVEQEMANVQSISSAQAYHIPYAKVRKILYRMLKFYLYKIFPVQESLPGDNATRLNFSLRFLVLIQVDNA